MAENTARSRYAALVPRRQPFLDRAREYSKLSIPTLIPTEGHTGNSDLYEPYQSLTASLVINLSSRILTALYPPNTKSFRFAVAPELLLQQGEMKADKDTERGLTLAEDAAQAEIERRGWRQPTNLGLQHLIVAGNVMEQMLPDNSLKLYRLDQYMVVRSPNGEMIEFLVEEKVHPDSLPDELRELVDSEKLSVTPGNTTSQISTKMLSLYTWGKLREGVWTIHQEIEDTKVPKSEGIFKLNPFNALRWSAVVGEDYGRAKVEEHSGDFRAIEGLSKSLIDGAAMASRNVTMIRPNAQGGLNLRRRLAKADNGDYVVGNPEDIEMLQFTNVNGLQIVSDALQTIATRLSAAFLSGSGMRRDAERVTAQELRMVVEELEGVLGGVFSMLAIDLQSARINRLIIQMQAKGQLPPWPEGVVEPTILTGLDALGREQDVTRVSTALQILQGIPPEVIQDYPKWEVLLGKLFNGLDLPEAVHTEEEVAQKQQQRAEQQAALNVAQAGGEAAAQAAVQGPSPEDTPTQ